VNRIAILLAALAAVACSGVSSEPEPEPPPPAECGWPYAGAVEAPPLPEGAFCWEVYTDGQPIELRIRDSRECWATGCSAAGCLGLGAVHPGDTLDAWGSASALDGVEFVPTAGCAE
jgi:hypothetical protein